MLTAIVHCPARIHPSLFSGQTQHATLIPDTDHSESNFLRNGTHIKLVGRDIPTSHDFSTLQ